MPSDDEVRLLYADRPSLAKLIERGDFDPQTASAGNVRYALLRAAAALKRERGMRSLSLGDVAERSGLDRSAICRLENGDNLNPKIETIGRIAGALGLEVNISIDEPKQRRKS